MPSDISLITSPPVIELVRGMVVFTFASGSKIALFPHDALHVVKDMRGVIAALNDKEPAEFKRAG